MFAAVGFTSLAALSDEIEKIAFEFSKEQLNDQSLDPNYDEYSVLFEQDLEGRSRSAKTLALIKLTKSYLIDYLLVQQPRPIYLSSPSGQVVSASKHFFISMASLSKSTFEWPFDDQSDLIQIFEQFFSNRITIDDIEYPLINNDTWTVRPLSAMEMALYTVDFEPSAEIIFSKASYFSDWAVGIQESDKADVLGMLKDTLLVKNSTVGNNSRGRPSVRLEAARKYRDLHPKGHESAGLLWKTVEHNVGSVLGKSVSKITIKRGLVELLGK